jgi:hypothetical protein
MRFTHACIKRPGPELLYKNEESCIGPQGEMRFSRASCRVNANIVLAAEEKTAL